MKIYNSPTLFSPFVSSSIVPLAVFAAGAAAFATSTAAAVATGAAAGAATALSVRAARAVRATPVDLKIMALAEVKCES